ncbi:MAG: amino acid adenylation domain-containing protein, partial [bacterium]|nr:amino acid adenylation domain-containing protein [bacterium]
MIVRKFEEIVERFGNRPAIKSADTSLTYRQLNDRVNRLARRILDAYPAQDPDNGTQTVGLFFGHGPDVVIALLAVLKAGKTYVPFDISYPANRLGFMLEHFEVRLLVTNSANMESANRLKADAAGEIAIVAGDEPAPHISAENPALEVHEDKPAYILLTSGSDGKPKGVVQSRGNLYFFARNYIRELNISHDDRLSFLSSISHDGTVEDVYPALLTGACLCPFNIREQGMTDMGKWMAGEEISVYHSVPTVFRHFAATLADTDGFPLVRIICMGAETIREHDIHIMRKHFPKVTFAHMYGQTESSVNTMIRVDPTQEIREMGIGNPLPGVDLLLLNPEGEEVEELEKGEIYVVSNHVALGYWKDPEADDAAFLEDEDLGRIYRSGDMGMLDIEGNIRFLGRIDRQVKIRGFRLEPAEIESRLLHMNAVSETVVTAREDRNGHLYLAAYMVARNGEPLPGVPQLKLHLKQSLPEYMIPAYFVQLDSLPLTANGKVDKKALPEPEIKAVDTYVTPRSPVEEEIARIWEDILGVEGRIGIDDNFFELGGQSLAASVLVSKLHAGHNIKMELADFFRAPTIRGITAYKGKAPRHAFMPVEPAEKREYYPLSPGQRSLFFLHLKDKESLVYNLSQVFLISGQVDIKKAEAALIALMERHESFRTSFEIVQGTPVQIIHGSDAPGIKDFKIDYYEEVPTAQKNAESRGYAGLVEDFVRPFDLFRAPLMRSAIIRDGEKYIWILDMHHTIYDGASMSIFMEEFTALYCAETVPSLAALPPCDGIQYKDYSQWRNGVEGQKTVDKQKQFWLKELAGELPLLNLPTDYARPSMQSFDGGSVKFRLSRGETNALKQLASASGATLFMVLLALKNILLAKLSAQEDIIIGSPIAGRRHTDLRRIIGMFVNTLALRNTPGADKTFTGFLQEVRDKTLQAYENQEYPIQELVNDLGVRRDVGRQPLFDTVLVFQDFIETARGKQKVALPELTLESYPYERKTAKFDLTLCAVEREGILAFTFEYGARLFKEETIERFIRYFRKIMETVIQNPGQTLGEVALISENEKRKVLHDFNATSVQYPADKTIHQLFHEQVETHGDAIALSGGQLSLSYKELNRKSALLAHVLREKGVAPDVVVGIMADRSIEIIIGILAILKAGGAYLPIDPGYPQERKRYMLADSDVRILLSETGVKIGALEIENVKLSADQKTTHPTLGTLLEVGARPAGPGNLAYIIYTSGSTGVPKGVMVEHGNVVRLVKNPNYVELSQATRVLQTGAPVFDATTFEVWGPLLNGGSLYQAAKEVILDADKLGKALKRHRINCLWLSSPLFNQLACRDSRIFASLQWLIVGGDVLAPSHINAVRNAAPGFLIVNSYGPTENTTVSTHYPITENFQKSIPIGKAISNSTAYIFDKNENLQPIGVPGELVVGGDGIARGYLNRPELTAERFVIPGSPQINSTTYKSGDLARWLPDGNIEFMGRIDQQVKIRGYRIELGEIENRLLGNPDVKEALVMVKGGDTADEEKYITAYVVLQEGAGTGEHPPGELRKYLSGKLPAYMIPAYFVLLEKFPVTINHKIDRAALPEPKELVGTGSDTQAPSSQMEKTIASTWGGVLELDPQNISLDDDFFELGGNSINILKVQGALNSEFEADIPMNDLFLYPTIRELAPNINTENSTIHFESIVKLNNGKNKENIFIFHPMHGMAYTYKKLADCLEDRYNVYGIQARCLIRDSVMPDSFDAMLKDYLGQIRQVQKEGPYIIAGYCVGAYLAYETVRELENANCEVKKLFLFDVLTPFSSRFISFLRLKDFFHRAKRLFTFKRATNNAGLLRGSEQAGGNGHHGPELPGGDDSNVIQLPGGDDSRVIQLTGGDDSRVTQLPGGADSRVTQLPGGDDSRGTQVPGGDAS